MNKYFFALLAVPAFCGAANAELYFGMPAAVKEQVRDLDRKVAAAEAKRAALLAQPTYPITAALTTLESTVLPVTPPLTSTMPLPNQAALFAPNGYGAWEAGPALAMVKSTDIMGIGYSSAAAANTALLLHFFTMSDLHITDVQSPAQLLLAGLVNAGNSSAYSPVIPYSTQALDAAVQTVNALNKNKAMDFGLFLGDAINNAQYNELRWYIDVLDGKNINPNSDPENVYATDYMRSFKAAGLAKTIPWYQVLGNHDHFYQGTWAQTAKTLNASIGEYVINASSAADPLTGTGFYQGVINSSTPYAEVTGAGPAADFPAPPKVNANPDRRAIPTTGFISEFFNTTSGPVGHGFNKNNISFPCYSFEPKAGLPLKVIVLDDTETDNVAGMLGAAGFLDQTRYNWLVSELDEGQAHDKLMIIAAHIPLLPGLWHPASTPTQAALLAKLHTYPNLLMWASGHMHRNTITPLPSTDSAHPEMGFWLVETPSLRHFPQEFRLFDVVRNSDNNISILAYDADPAVKAGSPAAVSRSYAVAANQVFTVPPPFPLVATPSGAYNAELFKQLSPAMQLVIRNYGAPILP